MNKEMTEEMVKNYLQPFVVQKYLQSNMSLERISELKHYADIVGFSRESADVVDNNIANNVLQSAMQKLKMSIVIQSPLKQLSYIRERDDPVLKEFWYNTKGIHYAIQLPQNAVEIHQYKTFFGKIKTKRVQRPQFLAEISPEDYLGVVPNFAIEAAGKAVEANLTPRIWVAGTTEEIRSISRQNIDPLIVGYPTICKNEKKHIWYTKHCLLLAAWGKDLEQIDSYFAQRV